jgi:two-component system sensor histidine kinase KdpD
MDGMSDARPNPDKLLAVVQQEESRALRGKLKIFFGAAPGVGKTYAMLEAARKVAKEGVHVLVGYLEPHIRPETQAQVLGLDLLPKRQTEYHGRCVTDFDLPAAIKAHPQLILVDELAHTNVPGASNEKRWQDVVELLDAGIDVYTTLNVQHLDSLNDVVARITTVPVRETVPDHVFEQAHEVELVDIAPDDLIERLKEGKVYLPEQALRAIENFFRKGNLIALRELALRKTAERVNAQAVDWRQEHDISKIWPTSERLLVCIGPSPLSAQLIRATRRLSASLRAPWVALNVEVVGSRPLSDDDRARLEQHVQLVEELGGALATISGNTFADAVLQYGRDHNITKIIIGKPQYSLLREVLRGTYVYDIIRNSGDIDVYVISGDGSPSNLRSPQAQTPISYRPFGLAVAAVVICTLVCMGLSEVLAATNLVMIYLACVVAVALTLGRGPSVLASLLSVATFDFFFIPPFRSFAVSDTQYLLTFLVMLLTGLVISELAGRTKNQTDVIRLRERRMSALHDLSRELACVSTRETVAQAVSKILRTALDADVWVFAPNQSGELANADPAPEIPPPERDAGIIQWVFDHRQPAGIGTATLPGGDATYLPLLVKGGIVGVLGIRGKSAGRALDISQMQLLESFAGQIGGALERCSLAVQAEQVRLQIETEQLRNSLLSAVSHDLRTPLATITGAASILYQGNGQLDDNNRKELAESIMDEADRLHRLVANLLDLTRLEAHGMQLRRELQPIEEVIGVVLRRMERHLREHAIVTSLVPDLPPVPIDGILIQQVLINLLDNAAKFAPPGTAIELRAKLAGSAIALEVADCGPGIPTGEETRVFQRFYAADKDGRSGSGIGLAICRGIIELHGGQIIAENQASGGACFRFTLPLNVSTPKLDNQSAASF